MPFVNYFASDDRSSPLNLAVARILVGLYAVWKVTTMIDWSIVSTWPLLSAESSIWIPHPLFLEYIHVEAAVVAVVLVGFTVGYRTGITGLIAAAGITHLVAVLVQVNNSGTPKLFLPLIYILLFFAVFRTDDALSIDGLRRAGDRSLSRLNDVIQTGGRRYPHRQLKWVLLMLGLIYFLTGYGKVEAGTLLEWSTGDSLRRWLQAEFVITGRDLPVAEFLIGQPLLADLAAKITAFLELGFVFAILLGLPIWPFVIGFIGMHTVIVLAMTPFFFDNYILFLLFVPWDRIYGRLSRMEGVTILYDDTNRGVVESLLVPRYLDVNDAASFVAMDGDSDSPEPDRFDGDSALYVEIDGRWYEGYQAYCELLGQTLLLAPLPWLARRRGVASAAQRAYERRVAD